MRLLKRYYLGFISAMLLMLAACAGLFDETGLITTPLNEQMVSGTIDIVVTPPEDVLVDYVWFFINSNQVGEATVSPYKYEWDTRDTSICPSNGWYYISVELYGQMGEYLTNAIKVYVENN